MFYVWFRNFQKKDFRTVGFTDKTFMVSSLTCKVFVEGRRINYVEYECIYNKKAAPMQLSFVGDVGVPA